MKKMRVILAGMLCISILWGSLIPASAAENNEPAEVEVTEEIPTVMLERMGRDVKLKDFIRTITVRDFARFVRKMKSYYGSMDTSARTLTTSWDLAYLDSACGSPSRDSIGVASAELNGEPVTLLTLGGTCFKEGQASGIQEDFLSAFEQSNTYLRNIVNVFNSKDENGDPVIPEDKPVIVTGISLGGMVAQQLLAQKDIMNRFEIREVICFGSPLLAPFSRREGTRVVRICDTMDIVPFLGRSAMIDFIRQDIRGKDPLKYVQRLDEKEAVIKDGGYKSPVSAHALSYVEGSCWEGYDVLGVYGGNNQIVMNEDLRFYENPTNDN